MRFYAISKRFEKDSPTEERRERLAGEVSVHSSGRISARVRKDIIRIAGAGFSSQKDRPGDGESFGDNQTTLKKWLVFFIGLKPRNDSKISYWGKRNGSSLLFGPVGGRRYFGNRRSLLAASAKFGNGAVA